MHPEKKLSHVHSREFETSFALPDDPVRALPVEIFFMVLSHLNASDLSASLLVSREWQKKVFEVIKERHVSPFRDTLNFLAAHLGIDAALIQAVRGEALREVRHFQGLKELKDSIFHSLKKISAQDLKAFHKTAHPSKPKDFNRLIERVLLHKRLDSVNRISDFVDKAYFHFEISQEFAIIGSFKEAIETAEKIPVQIRSFYPLFFSRSHALSLIAKKLCEIGHIKRALSLSHQMIPEDQRNVFRAATYALAKKCHDRETVDIASYGEKCGHEAVFPLFMVIGDHEGAIEAANAMNGEKRFLAFEAISHALIQSIKSIFTLDDKASRELLLDDVKALTERLSDPETKRNIFEIIRVVQL